jgi:TRAP-type C4-dicarboxylate transport system substrate-binding protein
MKRSYPFAFACAFAFAFAFASPVHAEPIIIRMASVAPEGSAWAKLLYNWKLELEGVTKGAVQVKWYFGAITGDELETFEGIKRGHLDGIASGGMICERLAPSMRIQGLSGMFQSRDEASYVMERLRDTIADETRKNGFEMLITTGLGPEVIFSRTPLRSMDDLRKMKLWRWSADEVGIAVGHAMKMNIVPTDLDQAAKAYDTGKIDGFIGIPTAALAFQWSAQARYITDLRVGYLTGCVAVKHSAVDRLPPEHQQVFKALFAKYDALFQDTGRRQDDALLGGLFVKQGLKPAPPSEGMRSEFFEAARTAREQTAAQLIPRPLLDRALKMLADYRAEHRETAGSR